MAQTKIGNALSTFPINKAVGALHSPTTGTGSASAMVPVPPPASLLVNGRAITIDVRSMSGPAIVGVLNGIGGVTASIDATGRLQVSGIDTIDGDSNLRALLGI